MKLALKLKFTTSQRKALQDHTEKDLPPGKRPIYFLMEQIELNLKEFVADREDQGLDSFTIHTLCAIDGHGKIRFRCHLEPIKPVDRVDFLESLHKQYEQRVLVCGTRLETKDINELQSLSHDDIFLVKLSKTES